MATLTYGGNLPWQQEVAKTASYTVLSTDSGTLFTNNGAGGSVTFTLPSLANGVGCIYWFRAEANQNVVITAPANKLIADGNLTGTSATYSTASHIIGSFACVYLNPAGTFWVCHNQGGTTVTIS